MRQVCSRKLVALRITHLVLVQQLFARKIIQGNRREGNCIWIGHFEHVLTRLVRNHNLACLCRIGAQAVYKGELKPVVVRAGLQINRIWIVFDVMVTVVCGVIQINGLSSIELRNYTRVKTKTGCCGGFYSERDSFVQLNAVP